MHSLGLKVAQLQRCPRIKQLQGLKTAQLLDYMYFKTELNTKSLLKNVEKEGVQHYLNKLNEIIRACDK